jgi:hypothetical protein
MSKQNIENLLAEGYIVQIEPIGYSMYPMFVPGRDAAILQKTNPSDLKRGDVVLYRRTDTTLVLHRIWKRKHGDYYMVGDNQVKIEGPLNQTQIKGKLIAFVRKGKQISVLQRRYRIIAGVWLLLRPVRRPIQLSGAFCKRIISHLFHLNG